MAFDAQTVWDLPGSAAIPPMSEAELMDFFSKQLQPTQPLASTIAGDAFRSLYDPSGLTTDPAALMGPSAPADGSTPPLTNESSPSPPASVQENNVVGDGTKRKAANMTRDEQPRAKVQHKASDEGVNSKPQDDTAKKAPARRKSNGTAGTTDENRLAKRKEQNRAAQRAFRDRKEKHVKDLEDKISELEQKYNTSESENTNLKDLLKRLQNENMALKQSAFTFEFAPQNDQSTSPNSASTSNLNTNVFTSPAQSKPSSSPESSTSPYVVNSPHNSLFKQSPPPATPAHSNSEDQITVNSAGFTVFTRSASGLQTPVTPALATSSPGAGPSTINHGTFNQNPLFTSYRDPSGYNFGGPFDDLSNFQTTNFGADFGLGFDMNMGSLGNTDIGAFGLGNDFDDLFAGQLGPLNGTHSYGDVGSITTPSSIAPTPSTAVLSTPISTTTVIDGLPSVGESARVECSIKAPTANDWRRCPKSRDEFINMVNKDVTAPKSTFGPPLEATDKERVEQEWQAFTTDNQLKEQDMDHLCTELFAKAKCSELKTRMKASMMRIAKDMANGPPA